MIPAVLIGSISRSLILGEFQAQSFLKETGNKIYTYPKFESFVHSSSSGGSGYYKSIIKDNIEETGYDHFVSFVSDSNKILDSSRETNIYRFRLYKS